MTKLRVLLMGAISVALFVPSVSATTFFRSPSSNWFTLMTNPSFLQPGDELVLTGGVYSTSSRLSIPHQGTAENPITIRAAEGADVTITRPDANQNVINIEGAQHLIFKDIEVTGGSAGIRFNERNGVQSKFVTLEGNHIHNTGDAAVAANINGRTYEGMHFVRNHIHDTSGVGEGFYLGCNNNACQFFDGIIEQNYIHDLNGPSVSQGDGIELKDGSYNNIIRDNVIHDTNFPAILAYGVEEQGARNIIERNVIFNSEENGIQVAADAIVRNNLVFSTAIDGIHIQNHQGAVPGNLTIVNNTIRSSGNPIDIGSPSGGAYSGPIEIANNALYPVGATAIDLFLSAGITATNNVGTGFSSGLPFDSSGNLNTDFVDFLNLDAFPAAGSKLIGAGDTGSQPADDFNTTSRSGSNDVGAYIYDAGGNPGWDVVGGFKEFPAAGIAGDFDSDEDVDGGDFLDWQRDQNVGTLADWLENFGTGVNPLAAAGVVPEPSSLFLLAIGSTLMCRRNRRNFRD